ncbi:MAG: PLD nuclease N-terminal domain-containing protein [Chloroflexota bacterium]
MTELNEMIPFLIPLIMIQLILIIVALVDLGKRDHTRGPKWLWAVLILFIQFIGPISYFVIGRED